MNENLFRRLLVDGLDFAGLLQFPFFAYGALVGSSIILVLIFLFSNAGSSSRPGSDFAMIILYSGLSLVLFLHVPHLFAFTSGAHSFDQIINGEFRHVKANEFYWGLTVIAANMCVLGLVLTRVKDLFSQVLISVILNGITWGITLPLVGGGIINTVWIVVFTGAQCGFILASGIFAGLKLMLERSQMLGSLRTRMDVILATRDSASGLLKTSISAYLALGASIGVSMTILFGQGDRGMWGDPGVQLNALRLTSGFVTISLGLLIWFLRPYLEITELIRDQLLMDDNTEK